MSLENSLSGNFHADSERARITAALLSVTADLAEARDGDAVLERFARLLVNASHHFKLAWLYIGDPDAAVIRPQFVAGEKSDYGRSLQIDQSMLMRRGPARRALSSRDVVVQEIPERLNPAVKLLPGVAAWHRDALEAGVRSVLAIPFKLNALNDGEYGLTVLYADRQDYFRTVGQEPFRAFARLAQVGLDRVMFKQRSDRYRRQVHELRFYDPLTGLANRYLLEDRLGQAIGRVTPEQPAFYISFDIRDFRDLNEHAGPTVGDMLLRMVGQRLQSALAAGTTIAHRGGGEFVVVAESLADRKRAAALVENCLKALLAPYSVGTEQLQLGFRGVVVPIEQAGTATEAVYRLSEQGHSQLVDEPDRVWCVSDRLDERSLQGQHAIGGAILQAMANDELLLYFQPQLRLTDTGVLADGAEALLRWNRADGSRVPPGDFIPQLERSEVIHELGAHVFDLGLRALERWQATTPDLTIGINVSARQLLDSAFVGRLREAMGRYPSVPPQRIELEITETSALRDLEGASRVLHQCRELGFGVAIDDYGSGYASLAYLQQLPVNRVKIDQQFVRRLSGSLRDLALVAGIIRSCQLLGIEVVAEGVEAADQAEVLARSGCDVLQGYWIGHPLPPDEFEAWMARPLDHADFVGWRESSRRPDALERLRVDMYET